MTAVTSSTCTADAVQRAEAREGGTQVPELGVAQAATLCPSSACARARHQQSTGKAVLVCPTCIKEP